TSDKETHMTAKATTSATWDQDVLQAEGEELFQGKYFIHRVDGFWPGHVCLLGFFKSWRHDLLELP
ncbi:MAG: hypothetical protein J0I30_06445, partial [Burkholderiales bacterium]|nr:hypothetical protein [Burkholderiales bacterium]